MPPSAAPEWLRVGWIFDSNATSAPASNASIAARIPAQPAPTTSTSCFASTAKDATETPPGLEASAAKPPTPGRKNRVAFGAPGERAGRKEPAGAAPHDGARGLGQRVLKAVVSRWICVAGRMMFDAPMQEGFMSAA